jgi:hypothetical protein
MLRGAAQVLSYLLHPLWVPALVTWWLVFRHPLYALVLPDQASLRLFAMVIINTVLFPGVVALLLWRLGFIKSLQMDTSRERIIPLNISLIFYFWAYYVSRNFEGTPVAMQQWLLGVFISSCATMFLNIFFKVSMHTVAMGSLVAFCLLQQAGDVHWPRWWLIAAVLVAGITGTARMIRHAHRPGEIYAGYLAGAICQVAGWYIAG